LIPTGVWSFVLLSLVVSFFLVICGAILGTGDGIHLIGAQESSERSVLLKIALPELAYVEHRGSHRMTCCSFCLSDPPTTDEQSGTHKNEKYANGKSNALLRDGKPKSRGERACEGHAASEQSSSDSTRWHECQQ